jgi:hypothetical protein
MERAREWNQARVNKSGEIAEHFRESCVKSGKYSYPVTLDFWKKGFNAVCNSPNATAVSIDWQSSGVLLPAGAVAAFSLPNQIYAACECRYVIPYGTV